MYNIDLAVMIHDYVVILCAVICILHYGVPPAVHHVQKREPCPYMVPFTRPARVAAYTHGRTVASAVEVVRMGMCILITGTAEYL